MNMRFRNLDREIISFPMALNNKLPSIFQTRVDGESMKVLLHI